MPKTVKVLFYYRHAHKSGSHISDAGHESSRSIKLPEGVTDAFYGPMVRTRGTLDAMIEGNGVHPVIHHPIEEIGRLSLEKEMGTVEFVSTVKSGLSNIEAVDQVFPLNQIRAWEEEFSCGVIRMFEVLTGNVAIAVGHDPFIPLAARYFGYSDAQSIRELEHVQFSLMEDGSITVNF